MPGSAEYERLISWLVYRQTTFIEQEEAEDEEDGGGETAGSDKPVTETQDQSKAGLSLHDAIASLPSLEAVSPSTSLCAGFNGRPNKIADTCYCFWVTGSLAVSLP